MNSRDAISLLWKERNIVFALRLTFIVVKYLCDPLLSELINTFFINRYHNAIFAIIILVLELVYSIL